MQNVITIPLNTKIARSFYELALYYEKVNQLHLAKSNYYKALSYDEGFTFAKVKLEILGN